MDTNHQPRQLRHAIGLFAAVAGIAAIAGAVINPGESTAANEKPTIVLVHGAWADASSWNEVVNRLQQDGYTVKAPPNPLRGLSGDSASVANFLSSISGPIVLVGHSYGGAVITNAATGNPNVKALVYVDAFIPDQGETLAQLLGAQPGSAVAVADPTQVFDLAPYPGAPAGDADAYLKPEVLASSFANDLPAKTAAVLASTQRPLTASASALPSGVPAWKTIPSWALIGAEDMIIPPAEQRIMAQRAGAHVTEIHASHVSMISHPAQVDAVIREAVGSLD